MKIIIEPTEYGHLVAMELSKRLIACGVSYKFNMAFKEGTDEVSSCHYDIVEKDLTKDQLFDVESVCLFNNLKVVTDTDGNYVYKYAAEIESAMLKHKILN